MAEIEAKFLVEDSSEFLRLIHTLQADELHVEPLGSLDVVDRYLDTEDWQVFNAGWAYRWRNASGKRKVGLKSVATREGAIQEREEVEQKVDAFPADGTRIPAGQVRHQLGDIAENELHELFQVHNNRRLFNIRTKDGALVELAVDDATITALVPLEKSAPGQLKFAEVELELKNGTQQALQVMADKFSTQFELLPSRMSKFERGLQTVGRSPPRQMPEVVRIVDDSTVLSALRERPLAKSDPAINLAYLYLLGQFEAMLAAEPRAWEGLHPDGVRKMRAATRRVRAAFRAFKRLLPAAPTGELNREIKWVASTLGNVRDSDVHQEEFQNYVAEISADDSAQLLDYQQYLASQRRRAREGLISCLSSQRYRQLKDDLCVYLQAGLSETADLKTGTVSIADVASRLVRKPYKRVLRHGRAITKNSPDEALHELGIDCQRLRYLLEILYPIYGKPLNNCLKPLKKLQTVLGEFQDACLAQERLRGYAEVPVSAAEHGQHLMLGQLIHAQHLQAAKKRAGFRAAWKRFDRKGRQKEILACLR